ncbi:methylated-DNA--[protein]-cysteine S-methyltransferase [Oceanithermus sp.]
MTSWGYFASPIGLIRAAASPDGLLEARLAGAPSHEEAGPGWEHVLAFFDFAEAYFRGRRPRWRGRLDLAGHTPRQLALWHEVMEIPYGETVSYAELGRRLQMHPRSIGAGMRAAPVLLVIPAHRVIHADGRVGGFAGFSDVKKWLLEFERRTLSR